MLDDGDRALHQYGGRAEARDGTAVVDAITAICEEFESYGWRAVHAALPHQGLAVNHKTIRRLLREHGLRPSTRWRNVATTNSDRDHPIVPNLVADRLPDGPDQFWVTDTTYVAILTGFAYGAVILDAWSRRVVGYSISHLIDARPTLAALTAAVERCKPPPGSVHYSDRGSQYAALANQSALVEARLAGSMGRRGNPYDNAKAESFLQTLKVEGIYPMAFETYADFAEFLPRFIADVYNPKGLHSALVYLSLIQFEDQHTRATFRSAA